MKARPWAFSSSGLPSSRSSEPSTMCSDWCSRRAAFAPSQKIPNRAMDATAAPSATCTRRSGTGTGDMRASAPLMTTASNRKGLRAIVSTRLPEKPNGLRSYHLHQAMSGLSCVSCRARRA